MQIILFVSKYVNSSEETPSQYTDHWRDSESITHTQQHSHANNGEKDCGENLEQFYLTKEKLVLISETVQSYS